VSLIDALAMPAQVHRIIHPYGDEIMVGATEDYCYSLPKILAEKLRAFCGQRRFALSRDLYDIQQLIVRAQVGLQSVAAFLEAKFAARGMSLEQVDPNRVANRRE
jgi:predicted nucleotidyltransferase component of viral defense system